MNRGNYLCIAIVFGLVGCQMPATMVVWQPPMGTDQRENRIVSPLVGPRPESSRWQTAATRVAIAPLQGPRELTAQVGHAISQQGTGGKFNVQLVSQAELANADAVNLVSFVESPPGEMALLPVAHKAGVDLLLVGEVLTPLNEKPPLQMSLSSEPEQDDPDEDQLEESIDSLTISWRVIDVVTRQTLLAKPFSVHSDQLSNSHPTIAKMKISELEKLTRASAVETWKLVTPFVTSLDVQLASENGWPGAKDIRRANQLAAEQRWAEAEILWRDVLGKHPRRHTAVHNLALAAVARQDFDAARELILKALKMSDRRMYQDTHAWITARQSEYDRAFGVEDAEPLHTAGR